MSMPWHPAQYLQFAGERLRPALDLRARVPLENPRTIVDLGCGAGNVTRLLGERWPDAHIVGVDSSAEMLREARAATHADRRRRNGAVSASVVRLAVRGATDAHR